MSGSISLLAGVRHLPGAFFRSAEIRAAQPAQWYQHDGRYQPVTYAQMAMRVRRLACGLIRAGVRPGERVAILMENRPEWAVIDYAVLSVGAVMVPLYCSCRPQDISYVLRDAGAIAIFTSGGKLLEHLLSVTQECPEIRRIYTVEMTGDSDVPESMKLPEEGDIDEQALQERLAGIGRDTLATLVYTSGTTASPKGVMLTHGNILANLEAVPAVVNRFIEEERMLSFLPLAHCLERTCGHFLAYSYGLSVAYAERPDTVARNLAEAEPSIMIAVPRMLEVMRSRILAQVSQQPWLKRRLFFACIDLAARKKRGRWRISFTVCWTGWWR